MIRILFPAFLFFALSFSAPHVFAEEAQDGQSPAPAEKAEEAAIEQVEKKAEAAEEKEADSKAEEEQAKAKEEAKKEAEAGEQIPEGIKEHQKASQEVFELTKSVVKDIKPEEQKHFFLLYNNYNLLGTVKMVQDDVGNAVEACSRENPEMKGELEARYQEWNDAVNPVMKEAEANINNMVVAQEYAKPAQIKKIFKGLDKTRVLANKQIEKTPVTTKDACEYLRDKMSDTQANFVRLLQSTLVSAPQVILPGEEEKTENENPAEEKDQQEKSASNPASEDGGKKN